MSMSTSHNNGGCNHEEEEEEEEDVELRRGPWTIEEDSLLVHYIACNGEGRWNMLAKCAGLKRTGKSCRLRWLNYLKPDVKRGNLSPQEQLLIHELHAKWGNRWSKIAQHLPGRTDNEIKNFWRTTVQKQARQLNNIETDNHHQQQQLQTLSALSHSYSASPSSSSPAAAICIQDNNITPVSVSPPSHRHNIFTAPLDDSSSASFAPDQGLYANSSNPFQNDDCYYVDSNHGTSSVNFGLGDATRGQVANNDWVMDDDVANSMWNNSDELWQFR